MSFRAPFAWTLRAATIAVFAFVGSASTVGQTQERAAAPPATAPQNPELVARIGEGDDPNQRSQALAIETLDVDVDIVGDTARTTVTAHFINSGPVPLEGNFAFDMPPNSVVTGYALDVGDKMVDGVLVGQRRARLTFESRERRGIDPGIAEVTRTGAFMTRVFPVLPRAGRTVRLTFVTPLNPQDGYRLPLNTVKPVGEVSIHMRTDASHQPDRIDGPDGLPMSWKASGGRFEAELHAKDIALSGGVGVSVEPPPRVQVTRHSNGDTFFEINDELPAGEPQAHPRYLRLYWDTSRSHRDADVAKEMSLVGRYIEESQPGKMDIVLFSSGAARVRSFPSPKADEVVALLKTAEYDGGTAFEPEQYPTGADVCLLFSDANATIGWYRPLQHACRWFAVSSAPDANRGFLSVLAQRSGGDYIDLTAETKDGALSRLTHPMPRVMSVGIPSDAFYDNYAVLPAGRDRFRVIGRVKDEAPGYVAVMLSDAARTIRTYNVDFAHAEPGDAPGALWAARKIEESRVDGLPLDALVAFSRRYSVASQIASFAVFENAPDYVEADAEPPPSAGEAMLADYRRAKQEVDAENERAQRSRMASLVSMWDEQRLWWSTRFKPVPRRPAPKHPLATPNAEMPMPAPPPPAPLSPAMRAPSSAPSTGAVETTVVTASRLPQANLTTVSPVTSISSEDIANTGVARVEDVVNQLPQAFAGQSAQNRTSIAIKASEWNPDRPYLKALNDASTADYWKVYRAQEAEYGTLPAFYLDVAEFFFRHGRRADAQKIVLNALELPVSITETMTIVADRLNRYGDAARAVWLYDHILSLEPDRPQPLRNLALALIARAERKGAEAEPRDARRRDYARALDLLNQVVTHNWLTKFDGIEVISLMEANRIIPKLRKLGQHSVPLDPRLIAVLDVDLRVVLEWNTDETDMDLWVDEPSGERAIYSNPKTAVGGRLSNDMTNGYGPEEYLLHRAPDGTYTVRANVYATDRINPNGATTVRVHIFRNYGRANEQEQLLELELKRNVEDNPVIGTIIVSGGAH